MKLLREILVIFLITAGGLFAHSYILLEQEQNQAREKDLVGRTIDSGRLARYNFNEISSIFEAFWIMGEVRKEEMKHRHLFNVFASDGGLNGEDFVILDINPNSIDRRRWNYQVITDGTQLKYKIYAQRRYGRYQGQQVTLTNRGKYGGTYAFFLYIWMIRCFLPH